MYLTPLLKNFLVYQAARNFGNLLSTMLSAPRLCRYEMAAPEWFRWAPNAFCYVYLPASETTYVVGIRRLVALPSGLKRIASHEQ